jgi:hypothetical protein
VVVDFPIYPNLFGISLIHRLVAYLIDLAFLDHKSAFVRGFVITPYFDQQHHIFMNPDIRAKQSIQPFH